MFIEGTEELSQTEGANVQAESPSDIFQTWETLPQLLPGAGTMGSRVMLCSSEHAPASQPKGCEILARLRGRRSNALGGL